MKQDVFRPAIKPARTNTYTFDTEGHMRSASGDAIGEAEARDVLQQYPR